VSHWKTFADSNVGSGACTIVNSPGSPIFSHFRPHPVTSGKQTLRLAPKRLDLRNCSFQDGDLIGFVLHFNKKQSGQFSKCSIHRRSPFPLFFVLPYSSVTATSTSSFPSPPLHSSSSSPIHSFRYSFMMMAVATYLASAFALTLLLRCHLTRDTSVTPHSRSTSFPGPSLSLNNSFCCGMMEAISSLPLELHVIPLRLCQYRGTQPSPLLLMGL